MGQKNKTVVLVAFYNVKALGVRYLERALTQGGWRVVTVYLKSFNSVHPQPVTQAELQLLAEEVRRENPVLVGLSVMSSMYLETVAQTLTALRPLGIPLASGGAFATMCPEQLFARGCDYVLRSDGETPLLQLAEALYAHTDVHELSSLCFMEGETMRQTPIAAVETDLDRYGLPVVNSPNACLIDKDRLTRGDPQCATRSYEVIASRGCPFTCSYCCCVNLRRLLPQGTPPVRSRSVQSVIAELLEAKKACKNLVFIHFYDEIFPTPPGWVDAFCAAYREQIGLPFTIWSHPSVIRGDLLEKLVAVGLTEVIMGIQSGSERILSEVFHRKESQDEIVEATRLIAQSGVFWASYDFMVQHPFETTEDLKQSYLLAKRLCGRFELQLHGLNFLPGTDIVPMAVEQGYLTSEQMDEILYAPMQAQFGAYWQRTGDAENQLWYQMLYCLQFPSLRKRIISFEQAPAMHADEIARLYRRAQSLFRLRYYYKKACIVLKSKGINKLPKTAAVS